MDAARIVDNYRAIQARVAAAAERSGRDGSAVQIVAVTKYAEIKQVQALLEAGCVDLGESRPQQLWERVPQFPDHVRWHLIGHLQRNKVERTLPALTLLHSLDSQRLIKAVEQAAAKLKLPKVPALLEVNIAGESAKHGFTNKALQETLAQLEKLNHISVRGLMGMASRSDADEVRRQFRSLRELRDELQDQIPPGHSLAELSMGMSGDFEIAIEEGATIVRVGSALYQ